jgi:hypothetical protein
MIFERRDIMLNTYRITFTWDDEAEVWIATSDDIHGLILEHSSFDRLVEKVRLAVPELMEMEKIPYKTISLDYSVSRKEMVYG